MKELIFEAYADGRLIAVIPFVCKVLDSCARSKVFRPPNPWVTAILGLLRELCMLPDLKMNLKFEIEVLCKNINVDLKEIKTTDVLRTKPQPRKLENPDFAVKRQAQAPALPTSSPPTGEAPVSSAEMTAQEPNMHLSPPQTSGPSLVSLEEKQEPIRAIPSTPGMVPPAPPAAAQVGALLFILTKPHSCTGTQQRDLWRGIVIIDCVHAWTIYASSHEISLLHAFEGFPSCNRTLFSFTFWVFAVEISPPILTFSCPLFLPAPSPFPIPAATNCGYSDSKPCAAYHSESFADTLPNVSTVEKVHFLPELSIV